MFKRYQNITDYILEKYFNPIPAVDECLFFPNPNNEKHLVNKIRSSKYTLDIAMFTFTNNTLAAAVEEAHKRGVKVRIITDYQCSHMIGSDVHKLSEIGIPVKKNITRYQMHHKFVIIDSILVITGSFNWTAKAVNQNQENILLLENKELAHKYLSEYEKLWLEFAYLNIPIEPPKYNSLYMTIGIIVLIIFNIYLKFYFYSSFMSLPKLNFPSISLTGTYMLT